MTTTIGGRGAVAVRPPEEKSIGWPVPVALLLPVLIVAGVALVLVNADHEGDDPGLDLGNDPQAAAVVGPEPTAATA